MTSLRSLSDCVRLLKEDLAYQYHLEGKAVCRIPLFRIAIRFLHPRMLPLILCRLSRSCYLAGIPILPFFFSYLNLLLFGIQITPRCEIGGGLFLPHPNGIVIGAWQIGSHVTIFQQVTLGARYIDMTFTPSLLPQIGDDVIIGAGAKILGGIHLEHHTVIGANSVVLSSVKANTKVAGIPARQIGSASVRGLETN